MGLSVEDSCYITLHVLKVIFLILLNIKSQLITDIFKFQPTMFNVMIHSELLLFFTVYIESQKVTHDVIYIVRLYMTYILWIYQSTLSIAIGLEKGSCQL